MSVKSPNILTDTLHNVDNVDDMHSVGIAEEEDIQSVQDSGLQNLSEQVELNGPDVQNWADDVDAYENLLFTLIDMTAYIATKRVDT